jgi:Holliday junction resolvase-like predicted endonuclease
MGKQIKPQNQKKETLESLYAFLRENEEKSNREWERIKKLQEEIALQRKESEEKSAREKKESEEKFDRKWEKIEKLQEETWRIVREVSSQLGGINNSNGDVAEEYFQSAFEKNPTLNGKKYDTVNFNMYAKNKKIGLKGEYDIVLLNSKSVAIIEVKYHLKMKDYFENGKMKDKFEKILNKTETFKALYPIYRNHKFYLGIAGFSFDKKIESRIIKEGIAVIKQVGDKMVINSDNLKEF